jgi:hypothetical protein
VVVNYVVVTLSRGGDEPRYKVFKEPSRCVAVDASLRWEMGEYNCFRFNKNKRRGYRFTSVNIAVKRAGAEQ